MTAWRDLAACKGRTDIDWFPTGTDRGNLAAAREVCASCPVSSECLEDARTHWGTAGIWAGTTAEQRVGMYVPRPLSAACGTESGYRAHRSRAEDVCGPCRRAHTAANRRREERRRERRGAA